MAFGNTATTFAALLKEYYAKNKIANTVFKDNVFYGLVPKDEKGSEGNYCVTPVIVAAGASRSATFGRAQAMAALSGDTQKRFLVDYYENHADVTIPSALIARSRGDEGAFLKAATSISDNQLEEFANDISTSLYRSRDGNRGKISTGTTIASSTLKFAVPSDVLNFGLGMELDVAAAQSTGNVRAYGSNSHGIYVSAIDYVAGTITAGITPTPGSTPVNLNDAADGIPTIATGDFVYVRGDRNLKLNGFLDWIPYGGPLGGDSFLGVDRTVQPTALAGNYLDGTGYGTMYECLDDAITQVHMMGGKLTHFLMPFKAFGKLQKELVGKTQLVNVKSTSAEIGYEGIKVIGSTGPVTCLPDRSCPANTICGMNIDTWELVSFKPMVHIWDLDGQQSLRVSNDSGIEMRYYSFGNLRCIEPRANINVRVNP